MSVVAAFLCPSMVVILATSVPVKGHLPCQNEQSCLDTETTFAFGYEVTSGSWRRANAHTHQKCTSYFIGPKSAAVIHSAFLFLVRVGRTLCCRMRLRGWNQRMLGVILAVSILPAVVSEDYHSRSGPSMQADDSQLFIPPIVSHSAFVLPAASSIAWVQKPSTSTKLDKSEEPWQKRQQHDLENEVFEDRPDAVCDQAEARASAQLQKGSTRATSLCSSSARLAKCTEKKLPQQQVLMNAVGFGTRPFILINHEWEQAHTACHTTEAASSSSGHNDSLGSSTVLLNTDPIQGNPVLAGVSREEEKLFVLDVYIGDQGLDLESSSGNMPLHPESASSIVFLDSHSAEQTSGLLSQKNLRPIYENQEGESTNREEKLAAVAEVEAPNLEEVATGEQLERKLDDLVQGKDGANQKLHNQISNVDAQLAPNSSFYFYLPPQPHFYLGITLKLPSSSSFPRSSSMYGLIGGRLVGAVQQAHQQKVYQLYIGWMSSKLADIASFFASAPTADPPTRVDSTDGHMDSENEVMVRTHNIGLDQPFYDWMILRQYQATHGHRPRRFAWRQDDFGDKTICIQNIIEERTSRASMPAFTIREAQFALREEM
jgi:hypothetical protein